MCAIPWSRHQMEIFSALLAICAGNSPVTGEFLAQRPVTRSFKWCFLWSAPVSPEYLHAQYNCTSSCSYIMMMILLPLRWWWWWWRWWWWWWLLVCDLNRTPVVMAKHGGPCVHFSGISTCGRTSRETFTSTASIVTNSVQNIFTRLRYGDNNLV